MSLIVLMEDVYRTYFREPRSSDTITNPFRFLQTQTPLHKHISLSLEVPTSLCPTFSLYSRQDPTYKSRVSDPPS